MSKEKLNAVERMLEHSRWLMASIYVGLLLILR
jgi:uncharacterized membrane protein YqhA